MHTLTHPLITNHGLKKLTAECPDLRHWLGQLKLNAQRAIADHRANKEIELILGKGGVTGRRLKRMGTAYGRAIILPPVPAPRIEDLPKR